MYKIKTILKNEKELINNTSYTLAEKLMPLVEEKEKMIARMCEAIAENIDGFCLYKNETDCDCADCKHRSCVEEVYNYFEREAENDKQGL